MDFASEYIVENYESEEPEEDHRPMGYYNIPGPMDEDSDSDSDSGDEHMYGFEACIMDFEHDNGPSQEGGNPTAVKRGPPRTACNTVSFPMKTLIEEPPEKVLEISEHIRCQGSNCQVVLSHIDVPTTEGDKKYWVCQFCSHKQEVANWPAFEDKQDILYMDTLQGVAPPLYLDQLPRPEDDLIIFVIDRSGSMSLPVKGSEGITKLQYGNLTPLMQEVIRLDQERELLHLPPGQPLPILDKNRVIENLSRLQTVKVGLIEQLRKMPKTNRVGLISFSTQLKIHGDCISPPEVISSQECEVMAFDSLSDVGRRQQKLKPLSESLANLEEVIKGLDDDGQTALGPALTIATGMAKQWAGAKVIVCTDGVANFGLGKATDETSQVQEFYDNVSLNCKMDGVSISIVSFDDCGLADRFGAMPKETGGHIEKVKSSRADFQEALARDLGQPIFATSVTTTLSVNKNMYLIDSKDPNSKESFHFAYVGNITRLSRPCYTFAFKSEPKVPSPAAGSGTSKSDRDDGHAATAPPKPTGAAPPKPIEKRPPLSEPPPPKPISTTASAPNPLSGVSKEATPFTDNPPTTQAKPTTENGTAAEGSSGKPDTSDSVEVGKTSQPFQYEVNFTTMNGLMGKRVWTLVKPVTASVAEAENHASNEALVSGFLQKAAEDILSHQGKPNDLVRFVRDALKGCEDQQKKCYDDQQVLMKLHTFQNQIKPIMRTFKVSDDTALELRKLEKGQS